MNVTNVHRITGNHQFISCTGAAIWLKDVEFSELAHCKDRIRKGIEQLGWVSTLRVYEIYDETVLVVDATTDQLYTACSLLEWATDENPSEEAFEEVRIQQANEGVLKWRQVRAWGLAQGLPVFDCEDFLTLGMGRWGHTFGVREIPDISDLEHLDIRSIPSVYVTGTNGKTTTSRILAQIARAAGYCDGLTSSDGVMVKGKWYEKGDWTGPGAARMVLRHPKVEFAILETARGGLMRRGLVLDQVDAAIVTNVSADHLGSWGIQSVYDMALSKLTVGLGIKKGGHLILNADDEILLKAYQEWIFRLSDVQVDTFSSQKIKGMTAWLSDEQLWLRQGTDVRSIVHVSEVPLFIGGAAVHNIENALAAMCAAQRLGISEVDIAKGLRQMSPNPESSRGRCNLFSYKGATIIVDFAHNPEGMRRIFELAHSFSANKKSIMFGQSSDRSEASLEHLASMASSLDAHRYYLKEMPNYSYDVSPSLIPMKLQHYLKNNGVPESRIILSSVEIETTHIAISELEENDLLVLLCHEQIDEVLAYIENLTVE